MNSKVISNGILRAVVIILGVIGLGYFLLTIQSVLVYIIIAAIIALIAPAGVADAETVAVG